MHSNSFSNVDAAGRLYQSVMETTALKDKGKYESKVVQQRRRNRIAQVCRLVYILRCVYICAFSIFE